MNVPVKWLLAGGYLVQNYYFLFFFLYAYSFICSCVYKCVCKQYSERLYSDLLRQITSHLERLCLEIQSTVSDFKEVSDDV